MELGTIYRRARRRLNAGGVPTNLTAKDRAVWPTSLRLFETDAAAAEKQWVYHPEYQDPSELKFQEGVMRFDVRARTDDEWAYIYLDPAKFRWRDYSWQMRFRRFTTFQEYAFNFRYVDFDNRYRYRFEDDLLFFDSKVAGRWQTHQRMPFPMVLEAWYDLRIDAKRDTFRCYVNGMLMMENRDARLPEGAISVILWEVDRTTDAVAEVGPMTVYEL